ncbi:DENN domain-containing protein 3-like [Garra rufa]|uniref:DENN domain-containing protein 3-like n=1 Tax=Garra rufa TaxID=137080 RepID=UPI003CCE8A98
MAENVPSGLLEACVVLGVSNERLKDIGLLQGKDKESLVEAEVLQVHAPPFVTKESSSNGTEQDHAPAFSRVQRRRSFKKKRERPVSTISNSGQTNEPVVAVSDDLSVPQNIDLIALPQLCFPDGLRITNESKEDSFHFLVFTDVFGNQTHGVVAQYCKPVHFQHDNGIHQNGNRVNKLQRVYTTYSICIISKYPYYNALRDCLSSLLLQLKTPRMCEFEEQVKEFSAKLALVPIPPPGPLHVVFNLRPFLIELPSRLDVDRPVLDLDLHLPFLCFKPKHILQDPSAIRSSQKNTFTADSVSLSLFNAAGKLKDTAGETSDRYTQTAFRKKTRAGFRFTQALKASLELHDSLIRADFEKCAGIWLILTASLETCGLSTRKKPTFQRQGSGRENGKN